MRYITLLLLILILAISCSTKKKVVVDNSENKPDTTVTTETTLENIIAQGKNVFENNCASCHPLPNIKDYTPENWKPILLRMQIEAQISDSDRELIYNYIIYN